MDISNRLYLAAATLFAITILVGCTNKPTVALYCEKDRSNTYLLKWEIFPDEDNVPVEIYMSENDSVFPSSPIMVVNSDSYVAVIPDSIHNDVRKFFKVKVRGTYTGVVSNRYFNLDSVQNFRDLGGYQTSDDMQMRWGMIYRSGGFGCTSTRDNKELNILGIKTIIDIQSRDITDSINYEHGSYIRIPVATESFQAMSHQIMNGRFLRGDAIIFSQDLYKDIIDNYSVQYKELFNYMLDARNYPVALNCYLGKDQTGLASYLLLRALNVSSETAEDDYMKSNRGIDRNKLRIEVDSLSESMQEALTMLTRTDISTLRYAISAMRKKRGSVEEYLEKDLGMTENKRNQLRAILLYNRSTN